MPEKGKTSMEMVTSLLGSLIVAAGIVIGTWQFKIDQRQKLDLLEKQLSAQKSESDNQYRNQFQRAFWEQQLTLYVKATSAAGILASSPVKSAPFETARSQFYELLWGPMSIVEDAKVKVAMEEFSTAFLQWEKSGSTDRSSVEKAAYKLAQTCRASAIARWDLRQFQ